MFIFGEILSMIERLTKAIEASNQNNFEILRLLRKPKIKKQASSLSSAYDDVEEQPSMKSILEGLEHETKYGIPGILFPADHASLHGDFFSEDGRVFIARDDQAGIFSSDVAAANFVACIIGKPWKKFYDQPPKKYFFPYFELTLDEAKYIHEQFTQMTKDMPWWE